MIHTDLINPICHTRITRYRNQFVAICPLSAALAEDANEVPPPYGLRSAAGCGWLARRQRDQPVRIWRGVRLTPSRSHISRPPKRDGPVGGYVRRLIASCNADRDRSG
jgi:hypothetical protein